MSVATRRLSLLYAALFFGNRHWFALLWLRDKSVGDDTIGIVLTAAVYGFSTLHWGSLGISGRTMGCRSAAGIVSEVVLFGTLGYALRGQRTPQLR